MTSSHTRRAHPFGPDAVTLVETYIAAHDLRVLGEWDARRPVPKPVTR